MLQACLEILLSLLAILGLLALGWMLFGRLLTPRPSGPTVFAVVPAVGDGATLEQTVRGLLWLRGGEESRYIVVLADVSLTQEGKAVAQRLAQRESGMLICKASDLSDLLIQDCTEHT